ncbi:hypothetical protein NQ317_007821 [Molorchus minor]|uniref:CASP-like protein n=1 Tax=Molorchus minor TaxID=1323400 RepID=A0ABQ9K5X5_9CUCU|nr:hypothetical protein NQ317_007821 [Molorchus minor]
MQKKTSESRKIICLTTTLEVLRLYNIFPKKDNEVNPGKLFYIKYIFAALAASVLLVSNSMHLFHTIIYKEYNHIDVDLSNILSLTGSYLVSIFCLLNSNTAAQMYILEHDLNDSFANCMLIQMILEAAILGCAASGFIQVCTY